MILKGREEYSIDTKGGYREILRGWDTGRSAIDTL